MMNRKKKLFSKRTVSKDIPIPGVKNIFKEDSSLMLRIAWIIILLLCIIFSIYQTGDAIRRYFSYPAVINVEMIRQVNLTLPSITFCPGEFLTYLYPDGYKMKPWPPENAEWWDIEKQQFHLRNYIVTAKIQYADSSHSVTMNDTEISTFLGICRLLSYDKPIRYKGSTSFSIFLTIPNYQLSGKASFLPSIGNSYENNLLFMLEDQSSYPLCHVFMYSKGPLKKGTKYQFELTAIQFKSKRFPNNPCEKDIDSYVQCWDSFVNKKINKIAKCRLPFIPGENLTVCNDYETLMQEYKNLTKVYDSMWDSEASNCLEICDDVHYHLIKLQEINMNETEDIEFHLDLSDNVRQIVSKDFGYTVSQMLSDIGGSLGLFLGCSVLSFLEILQTIAFHFKRGKPTKKDYSVNLKRVTPLRNSFMITKRY